MYVVTFLYDIYWTRRFDWRVTHWPLWDWGPGEIANRPLTILQIAKTFSLYLPVLIGTEPEKQIDKVQLTQVYWCVTDLFFRLIISGPSSIDDKRITDQTSIWNVHVSEQIDLNCDKFRSTAHPSPVSVLEFPLDLRGLWFSEARNKLNGKSAWLSCFCGLIY